MPSPDPSCGECAKVERRQKRASGAKMIGIDALQALENPDHCVGIGDVFLRYASRALDEVDRVRSVLEAIGDGASRRSMSPIAETFTIASLESVRRS